MGKLTVHLFPVFLILSVLLAAQGARPAYAAGYVVNSLADNTTDDAFCTLREAILAANNAPANTNCGAGSNADDTITFSVSGTITLSSTLPAIVSGQGALTIDGSGENITISGNNSVRVMYVNSGADLTLQNLTIANGVDVIGGGVYNAGTLTVTGSTLSGNGTTDGAGGAIYNDSTAVLTVVNSTFSGNSASAVSAGNWGGGIYNQGTLTVTGSTFSGNRAVSGGGIFVESGTATLKNTLIANSSGGGDCVGPVTASSINNLIEDSSKACGLTNGWDGNIIGVDPDLGALTGSPAYFPLNPGSPAIDAGDNATCAAAPVNNQSQNGVMRPKDGDSNGTAVCDIGSYERPAQPLVVSHSLQNTYTGSGPASFTVTFNQPVDDPPGNNGQDDVTNPANYLLIEKGANSIADTVSCAGGLAGDDVQKTVTAVSYNNTTFTATVTLAGALPVGNYRLFVCGTTSIVSDTIPLNNGADFTFDFAVQPKTTRLPATGFPMGRVTHLPEQPAGKAYSSTALMLEIPSLSVQAPIVGVPKSGGTWDVSWLGNSVGWLEGSAFPTWQGNTVLTGHVWNADNTPGVFAKIKDLKYGDRFYIHAFGQTYVYEVRENTWLWGASRVDKVFKHEERDWVTLLTCEGYNPLSGDYLFRRMVRAVLVEVK